MKVGVIKQIWRYPVKGMAGELLEQGELSSNGIVGDRIWALRDTARQEIQSCKFRPALLQCQASLSSTTRAGAIQTVNIRLPDGTQMTSDHSNIHQRLSELMGYASTLEPLSSLADNPTFYRRYKTDDHSWLAELKATFEREADEPLPDLDNLPQHAVDNVTLAGTFFLVTPFHLLTTASLESMQRLAPESDWAVERFRPNIVIETDPELTGLVEQAWLDKTLKIGNATVLCTSATPRCGAITKPQANCQQDTSVLRTVVQKANQNLGVYGEIQHAGLIKVGDAVYLQSLQDGV